MRWRLPFSLVLGVVGLALPACNNPAPAITLGPPERLELENRSSDLLLRAAESESPEVACNAIEALTRVAPRTGLPVFRKAVQSSSPLVRYAGLAALGELRDRGALPLVISAVKDESAHVRLAAAFAAARCGRDGYVRVLINALNGDAQENVRADAASLLGRLREPRAKKWLTAALGRPANTRSKRVTLAIYGALAQLGDENALHELINYSQGDPAARADALLLLADLGNPQARDALRYRLLGASEEYDEARLIAARGLGRLGYHDGFDLAMKLLAFLDPNPNPNPDEPSRTYPVRSMAIHALAEIGDARALVPLRELAAAQDDARIQVAASYAICRILRR